MTRPDRLGRGRFPEPPAFMVFRRSCALARSIYRRFPRLVVLLFLDSMAVAIMPVVTLWASRILLDATNQYFIAATPALVGGICFWVAVLTAAVFAEIAVTRINHNMAARISLLIVRDMQANILHRCIHMDYEHYDVPENQNTIFRAFTEASVASEQLFSNFMQCTNKVVSMLFSATALCFCNPWLCLLAVLIAVPNLWLNMRLARRNYEVAQQRSERIRKTNYLSDLLILSDHVRDNLLFDTGHHFLDKWAGLQRETYRENVALTNAEDRIGGFIGFLSSVGMGLCYLTTILWSNATGSVGAVVMNVGLFRNAEGHIKGITTDVANLYRNVVFLSDYDRLMQTEPALEKEAGREEFHDVIQSLAFEEVTFKYPDAEQYTLEQVSFAIRANECVCICGPNGAGKSTILKLLLRLYDPQQGRILINQQDIRRYSTRSLRSAFGVLLQDFSRYASDIRENVAVGKLDKDLTVAELDELPKKVRLKGRVDSFPQGSHTILGKIFGDGKTLSRGEWQKLGLARVHFRQAPVLVLDEPSSSLDPLAEKDILESFADMTKSRIAIIVTHRFSTVRFADRILVVDKGRVVECGSHEELMARRGLYEKMFSHQAETYRWGASRSPSP